MGLREEINKKRDEIVVDSYPMSIGEIINLYKDEELDVHPEFQRFYRWDIEQKSRFIESILLGIPIPPIFVAQKQTGQWDVIDGQQRLSTILEFAHCLKNNEGTIVEPLVLQSTKFLPSLNMVKWDDDSTFPEDVQLKFKREKLSFNIIKEKTNFDQAKYELFQRLNTGGSNLSAQEMRNCLLIMMKKEFYTLLEELNKYKNYQLCYPISEARQDERDDLEMVLRMVIYTHITDEDIRVLDKSRNLDNYITEQMEMLAENQDFKMDEFRITFMKMFDLLAEALEENTFRKFTGEKFTGVVMVSAVEVVIPGLFQNITYWEQNKESLKERIKSVYADPAFKAATYRGVRPIDRMARLITFSRDYFSDHEN